MRRNTLEYVPLDVYFFLYKMNVLYLMLFQRETAHKLRRNTITEGKTYLKNVLILLLILVLMCIISAASIFNYELRDSTTPNGSSTTPSYSPVQPAPPHPTPNPDSDVVDFNRHSDREYSPDMVIEKSYTPDLMRYANIDLPPHMVSMVH